MEEKLYSCKEVAEIVRVKVDTVYKWIKREKVEATRCGFQRYVFTDAQLERIKNQVCGNVGGCCNEERTDC